MAKLCSFTPQSGAVFSVAIEAKINQSSSLLELNYTISGPTASLLLLPESLAAAEQLPESLRRDELWKTTCFEAFMQPKDEEQYWELNLSNRGEWNVYQFDRYRERKHRETNIHYLKNFSFEISPSQLQIQVSTVLPPSESGFRLGIAVIIETTTGEKSYWALSHPTSKADFHDARGFQLELAALPTRN